MKKYTIKTIYVLCIICTMLMASPDAFAFVSEAEYIPLVQELIQNSRVKIPVSSREEAMDILYDVQAYIDAITVASETRGVSGYISTTSMEIRLNAQKMEEFSEEELLALYAEAGNTVESINSFLVDRLTYDWDAIAEDASQVKISSLTATAKGSLSAEKAICQGYANLFSILAEHAGIQNIKLRGYVKGDRYHVINVVRMDNGSMLAVDATSNDYVGENWSLINLDAYYKKADFKPEIDVETAFALKYEQPDAKDEQIISLVQKLQQDGCGIIDVSSKDEATEVVKKVQVYINALSTTSETQAVRGSYYANQPMEVRLRSTATEEFSEEKLLSLCAEAGETVESLNAFIIDRLTYDYDLLESGETITRSLPQATAKGSLSSGKSICQGYANLFSILADRAGIQNVKITGTVKGESHIMNVIRTEKGEFLAVDVTSNDISGRNWSLVDYDTYCDICKFTPRMDMKTAFILKYPGIPILSDCAVMYSYS